VAANADLPDLVAAVVRVAALTTAGAGVGVGLPAPLDQLAFWQTLPDDLLELLLFEHLDRRHPLAFGLLAAMRVLRLVPHEADAATGRVLRKAYLGRGTRASGVDDPSEPALRRIRVGRATRPPHADVGVRRPPPLLACRQSE
jgi:hypothetical protein